MVCGATPLFSACKSGHLNVVQLPVQNWADLNEADNDGWTPLAAARRMRRTMIVIFLERTGATPPRSRGSETNTGAHEAGTTQGAVSESGAKHLDEFHLTAATGKPCPVEPTQQRALERLGVALVLAENPFLDAVAGGRCTTRARRRTSRSRVREPGG